MPIGAGAMSGLNCHASPPSPSGTTFGALSWNLRGRYCFQTCGGSRMCESAEMRWYSRAMPGPSAALIRTNVRSLQEGRPSGPSRDPPGELPALPWTEEAGSGLHFGAQKGDATSILNPRRGRAKRMLPAPSAGARLRQSHLVPSVLEAPSVDLTRDGLLTGGRMSASEEY